MGKWSEYKTYNRSGGTARHARQTAPQETVRAFPAERAIIGPQLPADNPPKAEVAQLTDVSAKREVVVKATSDVIGALIRKQGLPLDTARAVIADGDLRSTVVANVSNYMNGLGYSDDEKIAVAMQLVELTDMAQLAIEQAPSVQS